MNAVETSSRDAQHSVSGSSFYAAMRVLPPAQRRAMFEIYGFCRALDDVADGRGDRQMRLAEPKAWRADIDAPGITQSEPAAVLDHPAVGHVCSAVAHRAHDHYAEANRLMSHYPL